MDIEEMKKNHMIILELKNINIEIKRPVDRLNTRKKETEEK
jgi:hypothetical protein